MKYISLFAAALVSAAVLGQQMPPMKVVGSIEPDKMRAMIYRKTGGMLLKPGRGKGIVAVVNAQTRVSRDAIDDCLQRFSVATRLKVKSENGTFDLRAPKLAGELTAFLVDDDSLPPVLYAPESRWAVVNVAPLSAGNGAKKAFLEARTKKELARALALLCGAQDSSYPGSASGPIADVSDLDYLVDDRLSVDVMARFPRYLQKFGVDPYVPVSYRRGCIEGWAPPPTNDVQKAIWEKVKADKERGPTNPIKIEPPKK